MKKRRFFCVGLISFVLLILPGFAHGADAVPQPVLDARESLVRIFSYVGDDVYSGTGFAVGDEEPVEYIVTNYHVVSGDDAEIKVCQSKSVSVGASIYRKIEDSDLCVLKLDDPIYDIAPLVIEDETEAQTGEAIYTLGFPGAADYISGDIGASPEDVTVTDGIISAVKSRSLVEDGPDVKMIQINAALNPGNSGGPLLNENGYVIGINTLSMIYSQNINAAIGIEELLPLLRSADISYLSPPEAAEEEMTKETEASEPAGLAAGWIVAIVAAAALLLAGGIVLIVSLRKRSAAQSPGGKRMSFDAYFGDRYRPFPYKLSAAAALVEQISGLHASGRYGFDICPENITVAGDKAVLKVRRMEKRPGVTVTRLGYSAPELYGAQGVAGPWSDVYAVSAVLYTVMTGQAPRAAFSRREDEPLFQSGMDERYKGLADAVTAGLAVDCQKRTAVLAPLQAQLRPLLPQYSAQYRAPAVANRYEEYARTPDAAGKPRWSAKKKAVVVSAVCLAGVVAVCGGLAVMCEINYSKAESFMDAGEYRQADESLQGVLGFYKDTGKFGKYVQAELDMDKGRYDAAKETFRQLGRYRDSEDMMLEADYRHAQSFLEKGSYDAARKLFERLDDYKDAPDMVLEADYQAAVALLDAGQLDKAEKAFDTLVDQGYNKAAGMLSEVLYQRILADIDDEEWMAALDSLKDLGNYKDSSYLVEEIKTTIYDKAQGLLAGGEYSAAAQLFDAISGFEQADDYADLCGLLTAVTSTEEYITWDQYASLVKYADLTDLSSVFMRDNVILYFLEGKWNGQGYYFEIQEEDDWTAYSDIPKPDGDYYEIYDCVYYVFNEGEPSVAAYYITYDDLYTIQIYCCENGSFYTMYRQ